MNYISWYIECFPLHSILLALDFTSCRLSKSGSLWNRVERLKTMPLKSMNVEIYYPFCVFDAVTK